MSATTKRTAVLAAGLATAILGVYVFVQAATLSRTVDGINYPASSRGSMYAGAALVVAGLVAAIRATIALAHR